MSRVFQLYQVEVTEAGNLLTHQGVKSTANAVDNGDLLTPSQKCPRTDVVRSFIQGQTWEKTKQIHSCKKEK